MTSSFTKDDTTQIKGIAILLMLMHHLWAFPDRIAGGELRSLFSLFGSSSAMYVGGFGKICVSFFFFLGGYGLYVSTKNKPFDLIKRLKSLYTSYWKVFLIFVPIGFLFFANQPVYCENEKICSVFHSLDWELVWKNFIGLRSSLNWEWWFLIQYVYATLTFPLIKQLFDKHSFAVNTAIVVVASILITNFFPALGKIEALGKLNDNFLYCSFFCPKAPFFACFWMGIAAAKDDIIAVLGKSLHKNGLLNPAADILMWPVILFLRQTGMNHSMDIFFVPLLVVTSVDLLHTLPPAGFLFRQLGKHSTNMWLIHSFFCYYYYPIVKIVVASRWAVPSLLILIVLSYIASVAVDGFWNGVSKLIHLRSHSADSL